jgi:hypothetical protein
MSEATNGLEYYIEIDNVNLCVNVMKYVFNIFHPNGQEQKLCSIHYNQKAGFTCNEAKQLCENIVNMLINTNWRKENNVY